MPTEAYILIRSAPEADYSRTAAWIRDLEVMPEVRCLQRVLGEYDLLATVEAPASASLAAEKILASRWVERVAVRYSAVAPRRGGVRQESSPGTRRAA
jgi:hypothetical protein